MILIRPLAPVAVALLLSCAAAPGRPPPSAAAAAPRAIPRSSIAAVLAHREELGLGAAEVGRLEALDGELARERSEQGVIQPEAGGDPDRTGAGRWSQALAVRRLRLDEADTAAFLRAEEALEPARRGPAREIAAAYRAALYDQRAAVDAGQQPPRGAKVERTR